MAENENKQEGENKPYGNEGYRPYSRDNSNRYGRNEGGTSYNRRYNSDDRKGHNYGSSDGEGGEQRQRRSYNPNYRNANGEERQQRAYTPRNSYNNADGSEQQQRSYRPRFNNGQTGENGERRQYSPRPRFNSGQQGDNNERRQYTPRPYNNAEGGEQQRSYRPRYNNNGGYNKTSGGYGNRNNIGGEGGEQQQRAYRPRYNNNGGYNKVGGYNRNSSNEGGEQRGFGQRSRFNNGGGYNNNRQRGGYRQRTNDYNPNAKYSMKKQLEYKEILADPDEPIRLNKYLANAGICSRREADEFITAGVVSVKSSDRVNALFASPLYTLHNSLALMRVF